MASVEAALQAQIRNIEATYGRPMSAWIELVRATGRTKHTDIIALLKTEHGMSHGNANRVALVVRDAMAASPDEVASVPTADPADPLYAGRKASLRPIHERLMTLVAALGPVEVAPKRGYLSLRHRKQFAMIQPAASHVDVGLILPGVPAGGRLEPGATFNAMFSHRVRVASPDEVDAELAGWLGEAYERAS